MVRIAVIGGFILHQDGLIGQRRDGFHRNIPLKGRVHDGSGEVPWKRIEPRLENGFLAFKVEVIQEDRDKVRLFSLCRRKSHGKAGSLQFLHGQCLQCAPVWFDLRCNDHRYLLPGHSG
jgi:hypothetical protein